jgi:ankyrin repeat protein
MHLTLTLICGLLFLASFNLQAVSGAAAEKDVLEYYTSDQLFGAVRNDDVAQLRKFFESNEYRDIDKPAWDGSKQTPLMAATLSGAPGVVQYLLDIGASTTIPEKDGYTPIHGAAFQGRANIAKMFIDHGKRSPGLDPKDMHKDG